MLRRTLAVAASLAGGAVATASAQEGLLLDTITVQGAGSVGLVNTATPAALKSAAPILATPQSVSIVTRHELTVRNVQTDSQALTYATGVFAQPFGGTENQQNPFFTIRGFSSAFGGSFVDGLVSPVNYRYEPYGIESYEVLRGPSSTLFGQADPGGLVNRRSKLPPPEPLHEVQLEAGSFARWQGAVDLGGPIDPAGRFLFRLTGLLRDADAPIDYDFGLAQPNDRQFIAPALTASLGERTTLTLLGSYLHDEAGQESVYRQPDGTLSHVSLNPPGYGVWHQEQYAAGYLLSHEFEGGLELDQALRYSHMTGSILGVYQGELLPDGRTVTRFTDGNDEQRSDFAVDTRLGGSFVTGAVTHAAVAGIDYQASDDRMTFLGGTAPDLDILDPDYGTPFPDDAAPYIAERYRGEVVGLYLQDQMRWEKLWLTLGVRHDWSETRTDDELYGAPSQTVNDEATTWRAGLAYVLDSGIAPYVSYAESFLPQSGVDPEGTAFVPTTGRQVEAGVRYQPPGRDALFSAAVYDIVKQNVPTSASTPDCPFCQTQTGEIRSRGVELQATGSLAGFEFTAAYAYNDAEITEAGPDAAGVDVTGNAVPLAPAHLASLWADYTLASGPGAGLTVGGGVRYVGTTFADDANTIENDPYTLVDAALRYDFGTTFPAYDGVMLALNVTNLFGTDYQTCFTAFADCTNGAPRTVIGSLTYRW